MSNFNDNLKWGKEFPQKLTDMMMVSIKVIGDHPEMIVPAADLTVCISKAIHDFQTNPENGVVVSNGVVTAALTLKLVELYEEMQKFMPNKNETIN